MTLNAVKKSCVLSVVSLLTLSTSAFATSIDWSGTYRFEYMDLDRTSVGGPPDRKSYFLHHLDLSPKIIAADGVNIVSRFDVLPSQQYPNSYVGQLLGGGANTSGTATNGNDSNVASNNQRTYSLQVTQLYLNLNQEYGSLLVGRVPLQFGLGITHNAGTGPFDHWYDVHDVVGYKVLIGNLSIMPMIGKTYDFSPAQGREVTDLIWNVEYDNPETESSIGLFHQTRTSSIETNDIPPAAFDYGVSKAGGWNTQNVNIYLARGFDEVKARVEAGFVTGGTGIFTATNEEIRVNGYGIALELDFPRPESKWYWQLKAGVVSGDNPSTTNYEGYQFDRNYDVAFLLFNHPMGRFDMFRTRLQRNTTTCAAGQSAPCTYNNADALDEEAISNVVYAAPQVTYAINDRWDLQQRVAWAQLQSKPLLNNSMSSDVGFEYDVGLVFKPYDRFRWVTEVGFLFPGSAWEGGANGYSRSLTTGLSTKAAITF